MAHQHQKCLSHHPGDWVRCQQIRRLEETYFLVGSQRAVFLLGPHMAEGARELCGASCIRALFPFMRAPPPTSTLPKATPPDTVTVGVTVSTDAFWVGGHRHSFRQSITVIVLYQCLKVLTIPPTPGNTNPKSVLLLFTTHFTGPIHAMGKDSSYSSTPMQEPFQVTGQSLSHPHPAFAFLEKASHPC